MKILLLILFGIANISFVFGESQELERSLVYSLSISDNAWYQPVETKHGTYCYRSGDSLEFEIFSENKLVERLILKNSEFEDFLSEYSDIKFKRFQFEFEFDLTLKAMVDSSDEWSKEKREFIKKNLLFLDGPIWRIYINFNEEGFVGKTGYLEPYVQVLCDHNDNFLKLSKVFNLIEKYRNQNKAVERNAEIAPLPQHPSH